MSTSTTVKKTYPIIDTIIGSLKGFALRDIQKIGKEDTVMASFILCACFIDQLSGFRYNGSGEKEFTDFIKEYLPKKYDAKNLRYDLRNKLVHNYSLGNSYSLIRNRSDLHLEEIGGKIFINIENFIAELEAAFALFENDLNTRDLVRYNALEWHKTHKIISKSTYDFLSFDDAVEIHNKNLDLITGFSKVPSWPYHLKTILIAPTGFNFVEMGRILQCITNDKITNQEALIRLSAFAGNTFEVVIVGADREEPDGCLFSFIGVTDYISLSKTVL